MALDVVHLRCLFDDEIMTAKDADLYRVLIQYDQKVSLSLELNGDVEYPSLSAWLHGHRLIRTSKRKEPRP